MNKEHIRKLYLVVILCLVVTSFLITGTREKREHAYWLKVIEKEAYRDYGVVFKEIEPKSVGIHQRFLAMVQSDGTVEMVRCDEGYKIDNAEWDKFYDQVTSLQDVVQIEVTKDPEHIVLVALKDDGTVYSTNKFQQPFVEKWSNIKNIVSVNNNEVIALSESGKIFQYTDNCNYESEDGGFVNLFEELFIRTDGSIVLSYMPDRMELNRKNDSVEFDEISLHKRKGRDFAEILNLTDVVSINKDYDYGYMVLRKDGSIWNLPELGGKLQMREELQGQKFIKVVSGFGTAGLREDGTVSVLVTEEKKKEFEAVG